ncbi:hypothetical protein C0992_004798 [Termitomyces sp. T32_za158]|nr:hypothetical protein C0992_004798 [Termitomyces sp. T32_za158]
MKLEILAIRHELEEDKEYVHRKEFRSASAAQEKEGKDGKKQIRERAPSLDDGRMKSAILTAELKQRDTENQRLQQAYKNVNNYRRRSSERRLL